MDSPRRRSLITFFDSFCSFSISISICLFFCCCSFSCLEEPLPIPVTHSDAHLVAVAEGKLVARASEKESVRNAKSSYKLFEGTNENFLWLRGGRQVTLIEVIRRREIWLETPSVACSFKGKMPYWRLEKYFVVKAVVGHWQSREGPQLLEFNEESEGLRWRDSNKMTIVRPRTLRVS